MIDFLVIGAQRSGTTSLRAYLEGHPELALSHSKEAPFFSDEDAYRQGLAAFERREFGRRDDGRLRGTVTPQYLVGGLLAGETGNDSGEPPERLIPGRIRDQLPGVKLVALLRDPVERCLSHFRLNAWGGRERRPLPAAIADALHPEAIRAARARPSELTGYVTWGEYGRLIEPYFDLFEPDQVLVELTAELEADPGAVMARVFAHIGVDPGYVPADLGRRHHASGEAWIGGDLRRKSTWRLMLGGRRLPPTVPLWRRLVGRPAPSPERLREISAPEPETVAALRDHYRADRERLERLLERTLPWPRS